MNMTPNPQPNAKLMRGLEKLKQTSMGDTDGMRAALADLHGAMEDFIRSQLAQKAPHLRAIVENPKTGWKDLLTHCQSYLGFTENDCNIIAEAEAEHNALQQERGFLYSYSDLVNYAQFVQKWVKGSQGGASTQDPSAGSAQTQGSASPEPDRPWDDRAYLFKQQPKPWYRSTLSLFVLFFLLPPVWAMLMLSDRRQNGLLRGIASLEIAILFFLFAYFFLPMNSIQRDAIDHLWQRIRGITTPTQVLDTIPTVPPVFVAPPTAEAGSVTSPASTCSIVWADEPGDALAGRNRSMAWVDVIQARVYGSGMTNQQFFDQVVEHNPQLVTDGYVFQAGKTYSLPRCGE